MNRTTALSTAALCAWLAAASAGAGESAIERGRYLSKIAGCNDCHTAGYLTSAGQIPWHG